MNTVKNKLKNTRKSLVQNVVSDASSLEIIKRNQSLRHFGVEESDSSDDDVETEIMNWEQEFYNSLQAVTSDEDMDRDISLTMKQTLILSTLVPDMVLSIDKYKNLAYKQFVGVLMIGDVSGYTALSEKYQKLGKGGTYRLTATLNTYLGSLIEIIYKHGGDVIKFAGDAFLALWQTDNRTFINHTIHSVIHCALVIQHSYSSYKTDVKVNLKVKLAISAGNLIFTPVGSGTDMSYIVLGLPVLEAKAAESVCASGEVVIAPTAWGHCYSRNYDHVIKESGHVTILSILYDPREKNVSKPFSGTLRLVNKPVFNAIEAALETDDPLDLIKKNETLNVRKSIINFDRELGAEIRKFMIKPILTQIDAHQPLEYLTEMRSVTILFITLKPRPCPSQQLITIIHNSYESTCEIVYKSMGCVNKIILFDKDVMILVIFGLRGFNHESEAQAALKCAQSIKRAISNLDGVLEVSMGVTTGSVYCGVVGHPLRREFTVIGAIVNKAARLMCNYRNKITCDENTYYKSKITPQGFTLQEKIQLKGIDDAGKIFEYNEDIRTKIINGITVTALLLDREIEMDQFNKYVSNKTDISAILLIGEHRVGKSKLLAWMARHAKQLSIIVCFVKVSSVHSATPFLAISQIFNQLLGLSDPIIGFQKEDKIVQLLGRYTEDLSFLNDVLKVKFAYHEVVHVTDDLIKQNKAKQLFVELLKAIKTSCLVLVDDLQDLDQSSWEYMSLIIEQKNFHVIFTLTRGKFLNDQKWLYNIFTDNRIKKMIIGPLPSDCIPTAACQMLDVRAISQDLCDALRNNCRCIPGLIESFLEHLYSSGAIEITNNREDMEENDGLNFPNPTLLRMIALDAKQQNDLDEYLIENKSSDVNVCIVKDKTQLNTDITKDNLDAIFMIQIDSLNPYQQLLIKIASVIGDIFSRDLLENIMYDNDPFKTAKAIKKLFQMNILLCANAKNKNARRHTKSSMASNASEVSSYLECECNFVFDEDQYDDNLPKFAYCHVMKFRSRRFRNTCYELLPINQKKDFHSRVVHYLENSKQKCVSCGGIELFVKLESVMSSTTTNLWKSFDDFKNVQNSHDYPMGVISDERVINSYDMDIELSENKINVKQAKSANSLKMAITSCYSLPVMKSVKTTDIENSKMNYHKKQPKRVTMSQIKVYDYHDSLTSTYIESQCFFSNFREIIEAKNENDWEALGLTDREDTSKEQNSKSSYIIEIEKNLSQIDFSKCTCAALNVMVAETLVHHAKQADLKIKLIEFLIKFSYLSVIMNSVDGVFDCLKEAKRLCENKNIGLSKTERKIFLAQIYTIMTSACMIKDNYGYGKLTITRAQNIYSTTLFKLGKIFTITPILKSLKIKSYKFLNKKYCIAPDVLFFLNVACIFNINTGDIKAARICMQKALYLIKKAKCRTADVLAAFSNALNIELGRGNMESSAEVERKANDILNTFKIVIGLSEIRELGKLFTTSFYVRIARGNLTSAIHAGLKSLVISKFLYTKNVTLEVIPDLYYILLSRCCIKEAVDLLNVLFAMSRNRNNTQCEMWYYALCMDLILDFGVQFESPVNINRFAEFWLGKKSECGQSYHRLITGIWTYWLRSDIDSKAKIFENECLKWLVMDEDNSSLTVLITNLRLAEGLLESLARKVDDLRKVVDMVELRSLAQGQLSRLYSEAQNCRAILPRWIRIKANAYNVSGRPIQGSLRMTSALEIAKKYGNIMEEQSIIAISNKSKIWRECALANIFIPWEEAIIKPRDEWNLFMYS